jgi:hypothetical protein
VDFGSRHRDRRPGRTGPGRDVRIWPGAASNPAAIGQLPYLTPVS